MNRNITAKKLREKLQIQATKSTFQSSKKKTVQGVWCLILLLCLSFISSASSLEIDKPCRAQNQQDEFSKNDCQGKKKEILNKEKIELKKCVNRPRNYDYRLSRIPSGIRNSKREWWDSTFNIKCPNQNQNKMHLSCVIGNSQQGKDTFIANLDPELLEQNLLKLGNGNDSCTKSFEFIQYNNPYILDRAQGVILNTIGLGDTKLEKRDDEIVFEIFRIMMEDSSQIASGINTFYFVQSLTTEPVGAIERSMILMEAALGKEIFKSSVIIATKGNNIIDERQLESGMNYLKNLAKKYNVQGGVIDYRAKFKFQGEGEIINPLSEVEEKEQQDELRDTVQSLPFYSLKPLFNQLKEETDKLNEVLQKNNLKKKIVYVEKVRYERHWFTLWLFKQRHVYYDQEYQEYFEKTTQEVYLEAMKRVLDQNLENMKVKLQNATHSRQQ